MRADTPLVRLAVQPAIDVHLVDPLRIKIATRGAATAAATAAVNGALAQQARISAVSVSAARPRQQGAAFHVIVNRLELSDEPSGGAIAPRASGLARPAGTKQAVGTAQRHASVHTTRPSPCAMSTTTTPLQLPTRLLRHVLEYRYYT